MATRLDDAAIDRGLTTLNGWRRTDRAIQRQVKLASFRDVIALIVRIAFEAEQRDHHPELTNVYDQLTITLTTHDAGGLTEKDFDLAAAIDTLV